MWDIPLITHTPLSLRSLWLMGAPSRAQGSQDPSSRLWHVSPSSSLLSVPPASRQPSWALSPSPMSPPGIPSVFSETKISTSKTHFLPSCQWEELPPPPRRVSAPPGLCSAAWALDVYGPSHLAAMCIACPGLCSPARPTGLLGSSSRSTAITAPPLWQLPIHWRTRCKQTCGQSGARDLLSSLSELVHSGVPSLKPAWSPFCFLNISHLFFAALY